MQLKPGQVQACSFNDLCIFNRDWVHNSYTGILVVSPWCLVLDQDPPWPSTLWGSAPRRFTGCPPCGRQGWTCLWELAATVTASMCSTRKFLKQASSPCETTSNYCLWCKVMCINHLGLLTGQGRKTDTVYACTWAVMKQLLCAPEQCFFLYLFKHLKEQ